MSKKIEFIITEDGRKRYATRKCSVLNCNSTNLSTPKRTFFVVPSKGKNPEKRDMWIKALNKVNCLHPSHRKIEKGQVCSDHFVSGFASQTRSEVDYVPTIFPRSHCKAHGHGCRLPNSKNQDEQMYCYMNYLGGLNMCFIVIEMLFFGLPGILLQYSMPLRVFEENRSPFHSYRLQFYSISQ